MSVSTSSNSLKLSEAEVELAKTELSVLSQFVSSPALAPNSYVRVKCADLVRSLQNEIDTFEAGIKSARHNVTLKAQVNFGNAINTKSLVVPSDSTLGTLKIVIEKQIGGNIMIERIKVKRTGRAWGEFDSRTLSSCEILNNDEIVVDCKSATQSNLNYDKSLKGLRRVATSAVHPSDAFELVVVALHCILLDLDFLCVVEFGNTTPGFAPSVRELPPGSLLPPNWNTGEKVSVIYKHKGKPGKQFLLEVTKPTSTGDISVRFAPRQSASAAGSEATTLNLTDYVVDAASPLESFSSSAASNDASYLDQYHNYLVSRLANREALIGHVVLLVQKVAPELVSPSSKAALAESSGLAMNILPATSSDYISMAVDDEQQTQPQQTQQTQAPSFVQAPTQPPPSLLSEQRVPRIDENIPSSFVPPPPQRAPQSLFGTGRADLEPFPSLLGPRGSPGISPAQPGSGSLVGPDHPMFYPPDYGSDEYYGGGYGGQSGGQGNYFFPGGGLGPGAGGGMLPQPRFDPYGPVVNPNSGVDVGNVGIGGRGGRGGRGGVPVPGRGRPGQPFPGEPNPDHLKPPGW